MLGHTLILNSDWSPISVLPLSTFYWQDAVKALYLGTVKAVANYDNWVVSSPSQSIEVPAVVVSSDFIKYRKTVSFTKEHIYLRDGYECQYCERDFIASKLTLDHVVPKSKGGKLTWDNTTSACSPCNTRRGNNMRIRPKKHPHRPNYFELVEIRKRFPIVIPHTSWAEYIDWPEDLIRIQEPQGVPGIISSKPKSILKPLLMNT